MAVESKRGCGYRKVGGLYLVDDGGGMPCCKMPLPLTICPCGGGGIKQSRGWTWVDAGKLFPSGGCTSGGETAIREIVGGMCPAANPGKMGRVGLIWIGESFYKTPADFFSEAATQGISRRLANVPREYKPGETWVLFAHAKAIPAKRVAANEGHGWQVKRPDGEFEEGIVYADSDPDGQAKAEQRAAELDLEEPLFIPGVIRIARPRGFEKIVKQSDFDRVGADRATFEANDDPDPVAREKSKSALLVQFERDAARGIKWIPVPDDDKDHQGTVYDKPGKEEE